MDENTLSFYDDFDVDRYGEDNGEGLFSPFTYLCFVLILVFMGLMFLYSSSFEKSIHLGNAHYAMFFDQIVGLVIGLAFGVGLSFVPQRFMMKAHHVFITLTLAFYGLTFFLPAIANRYGFSDYLGLCTSISLVSLYAEGLPVMEKSERRGFPLVGMMVMTTLLLTLSLLLCGPGWFFVEMVIILSVMSVNNTRVSNQILVALMVIVTGAIICFANPYTAKSISSSVFPLSDATLYNSQLYISQMAIRDGGIIGTGLGRGVYKLGLLTSPEGHLIFATVSEESGIIGPILILLSLLVVFIVSVRTVNRARRKDSQYAASVVMGLSMLFVFSSLLNLLYAVGYNPFGGIALPLFSYSPVSEGMYISILCLLYKYIYEMGRSRNSEK